jgi:hypothetical protein
LNSLLCNFFKTVLDLQVEQKGTYIVVEANPASGPWMVCREIQNCINQNNLSAFLFKRARLKDGSKLVKKYSKAQ